MSSNGAGPYEGATSFFAGRQKHAACLSLSSADTATEPGQKRKMARNSEFRAAPAEYARRPSFLNATSAPRMYATKTTLYLRL